MLGTLCSENTEKTSSQDLSQLIGCPILDHFSIKSFVKLSLISPSLSDPDESRFWWAIALATTSLWSMI